MLDVNKEFESYRSRLPKEFSKIIGKEKMAESLASYKQTLIVMRGDRELWVQQLKEQGIKAAIINDGWVYRNKNISRVRLEGGNIIFNDGLEQGDLAAFGHDSKDYKIARFIGKDKDTYFTYYVFQDTGAKYINGELVKPVMEPLLSLSLQFAATILIFLLLISLMN